MIEINTIRTAQAIQNEIEQLTKERYSILNPQVPTQERLIECYEKTFDNPRHPESTRVFIFLWLYYYDRGFFTGQRMKRKTRKQIAIALGLRNPEVISMRSRDLLFSYITFASFRNAVNRLDEIITNKQI